MLERLKLIFRKNWHYIFYLLAFILLFPVANYIDFYHNDDWVYTLNVQNFINGVFSIHPYIASNFYSTGLIGAFFSLIFGIDNLPILTLFVSILSSVLVFKTLHENIEVPKIYSFLCSLIFLFNPLYVFTSWGFMTDNYFNLFLILSFYFLSKKNLDFSLRKDKIIILLGIFFILMAYFTRQVGVIVYLAFGLWYFSLKKYWISAILFISFVINMLYHFLLFPKTSEAFETMLVFDNLIHFQYVFSLFFAIFAYLSFFSIFLIFQILSKSFNFDKKFLIGLIFTLVFLTFSNFYFKNIGWIGEKMYFFNYTLNTKGFFPENISGKRSESFLSADIMLLLQNISIFLGFWVLFLILVKSKGLQYTLFNPFFIFLIVYSGVLIISVKVYDRYLIPLFSAFVFFISMSFKHELQKKFFTLKSNIFIVIGVFLLFLYSYNLSADYILTNKFVWNKSIELTNNGVSPETIYGTDAWRYLYGRENTVYKFTYDSKFIEKQGNSGYQLDIEYNILYPFQIFSNNIYLYSN